MSTVQYSIFGIFFFIVLSMHAQKKYQKNYFDNGNLQSEGWIQDSQKTDYWKFYYKNGNTKKEGHFNNSKLDKYWYFYYENGVKNSQGYFINGKKMIGGFFMIAMSRLRIRASLKII
ncbi:MAG: hypothetical protein JKY51_07120 [Opitutaceae bacterium]|nr:hypothetical protein [Opitutaceae bacterium]